MKTERPHHSQVEECKKWDEEYAAEVAAAEKSAEYEPAPEVDPGQPSGKKGKK